MGWTVVIDQRSHTGGHQHHECADLDIVELPKAITTALELAGLDEVRFGSYQITATPT